MVRRSSSTSSARTLPFVVVAILFICCSAPFSAALEVGAYGSHEGWKPPSPRGRVPVHSWCQGCGSIRRGCHLLAMKGRTPPMRWPVGEQLHASGLRALLHRKYEDPKKNNGRRTPFFLVIRCTTYCSHYMYLLVI